MMSRGGIGLLHTMPYALPFVLFAFLTYGGILLDAPQQITYPAKTFLVGSCLLWFRRVYKSDIKFSIDWFAIIAGCMVFVTWVGLEGCYPLIGRPNIHAVVDNDYSIPFFFIRVAGAAFVVPLMEELFWRSFALRYLVDMDFMKVRLGKCTWFSFIVVSLAFGFEHHRWLPGIIAGAAYAGVLYRSGNLFAPILAHGTTNLLLGIYVIYTGRWEFW